jgi:hypothetical protein
MTAKKRVVGRERNSGRKEIDDLLIEGAFPKTHESADSGPECVVEEMLRSGRVATTV